METDRTGSFEYNNGLTNEQCKSIIIEKIEDDLEDVKNQLDSSMSSHERRKFKGMQAALEQLKAQINAIEENSIRLVDPTSDTLQTPQHLSTDNKFLNEAYHAAIVIRDSSGRLGDRGASSPEGASGKRAAMSKIMNDIKTLV